MYHFRGRNFTFLIAIVAIFLAIGCATPTKQIVLPEGVSPVVMVLIAEIDSSKLDQDEAENFNKWVNSSVNFGIREANESGLRVTLIKSESDFFNSTVEGHLLKYYLTPQRMYSRFGHALVAGLVGNVGGLVGNDILDYRMELIDSNKHIIYIEEDRYDISDLAMIDYLDGLFGNTHLIIEYRLNKEASNNK